VIVRRRERGGATVELVLTVPVLLLLIMLIVQFGLYWHANHVAQAAAQEGVRAARMADGTAETGRERARAFVTSAAPTLLHDVDITASRNTQTAGVHVHATVQAVVPGLSLAVDVESRSPTEHFHGSAP
jgi:Flp pilus assembly protein TadG